MLLTLAAAGVASFPVAAHATTAGRNGAIIYTQYNSTPFDPGPNQPDSQSDASGDYEVSGDLRIMAGDGSSDRVLIATPEIDESAPAISPDGRTVTYTRYGLLWRVAVDGTGAAALRPKQRRRAENSAWSPDGSRIAYGAFEGGISTLSVTGSTGPTTIVPIPPIRPIGRTLTWSALPRYRSDGSAIVYLTVKFIFGRRLRATTSFWTAQPDGSEARRLFRGSGSSRSVLGFDLSPDGRHIVFAASDSWKTEPRRLFVAAADGANIHELAVASAGHTAFGTPAWSPDGTKVVVSETQSSPERGSTLLVLDAATGARTVLKRITTDVIDEPQWQALPAAP